MTIGNWIINAYNRNNELAVEYKFKHKWQKLNWQDYIAKVISAYYDLKKNNLKDLSHVGIMASTCWQWAALDLALLGTGHVVVPIYPNLNTDDLLYIINHSDINILIIETDSQQKQIEAIQNQFKKSVKIIKIETINFNENINETDKNNFFKLCAKINSQQIATIVYTSGTTGQPKGAVLLHSAITSEVTEGFKLFGVKSSYKSLTFLPFAHVLGRIEHWGSCWNGHAIAYAESVDKIKSNLIETKPDFLIAVPRIFEKIYSNIMNQVETKKYTQKIFSLALESAVQIQKYRHTKESIPWPLLIKYEALNKIAFANIKNVFGGNLKFAISGGAPISTELVDFFNYCGLPILEGYGLTETCAAVCVNSLTKNQRGTVGKPIGDVQIKFAKDGEILIKSAKCLTEYYKNKVESSKNIIDGYFSTGDIGELTPEGFLKITDRKKDLIKTSGGKYVAPQKLEGLLKQDPLISQVLIHGDQKKYISALITFDLTQLTTWAKNQQIQFENPTELYQNLILKLRIQKHIQKLNSNLASYEAIKKFEIISDEWTVENDCLTPSLKVKRKHLEGLYKDLIRSIYD